MSPSRPSSPPPSRSPRRRRGKPIAAVGVLALAILLGRGLGWFGGSAGGGGDAADPAKTIGSAPTASVPAAVMPAPPNGKPLPPSATTPAEPGAVGTSPSAPGPTGEAAQLTGVPGTVPDPAVRPDGKPLPVAGAPGASGGGIDSDRFASMSSLLATRTADGALGDALATLHHLRGLPLDAAQTAALQPAVQALEQALAAQCARIVEALGRGQALAARGEAARLLGDGSGLAAPWLDSAMQVAGRRGGLLRPLGTAAATTPTARPLARGREVRVLRDGRLVTGTIADSRSDEVTVKLSSSSSLSFPTVAVVDCEPVDASRDEAVELAFAALHRGDVLLARLWHTVAAAPGGPEPGERGKQLATLLE